MKTLNTKRVAEARTRRMRDTDESNNMHDIVGIMLRGQNLDIEVLVTFNRMNSTFYENYNSTILSELTVVTSPWKTLTTQGQVRIRNLRAFYEKKMPQEMRKLRMQLNSGNPPEELPPEINMGVREHINHPQLDPDVLTMYDLDNIHISSVVKTKADVKLGDGDDFVSVHSYMEQALTNAGFNLTMEAKTRNYRKYSATFQGSPLSQITIADTELVKEMSDAIELAIGSAGWTMDPNTFPVATDSSLTWTAQGPSCGMRISSTRSTVEFFRI